MNIEPRIKSWRRGVVKGLLLFALIVMPTLGAGAEPQVQQPENGGVAWSDAGIGAATMLANVVYVPVKFVYAALGGIAGGFAFVLTGGNTQVSDTIWRASLGGDYVLTPRMITGKDPIHFSGPTSIPQSTNVATQGASPAASAGANNSVATSQLNPTGSGSPAGTASTTGVAGSPPSISSAPRPIDRGAGPVNAPNPVPTPDTSIE